MNFIKFLIFFGLQIQVFATQCIVPGILLETIKITENETLYPFYIRTNDNEKLNKFNEIIKYFNHKKTEDTMVVDCINSDNCTKLATALIKENIINLDLGLFQINYKSFKYQIHSYFDEELANLTACKVIEEKIRITKNWSWETLATYHSLTPKLNKIYKEKLIKNYIKLLNK
jgi:hypothetical protein